MKYSILGFNQEKVVTDTFLDLIDLAILSYIKDLCGVSGMYHKVDEDGNVLVWIMHDKLLSDLPILKISDGRLRNKLTTLKTLGYINSLKVNDAKGRGSRTYYGLTEKATNLIYNNAKGTESELEDTNKDVTTSPETTSRKSDMVDVSTSRKSDMVSRPRHEKVTSDNILNNKDNRLKNDKEIRDSKIEDFTHSYNTICTNLPTMKRLTDGRTKKIKKLLNKYSMDDVITVFSKANDSSFLIGKNDRGWKADFDFFLREDKFINVLEGKYDNHIGTKHDKYGEDGNISSEKVTQEEIDNGHFTGKTM